MDKLFHAITKTFEILKSDFKNRSNSRSVLTHSRTITSMASDACSSRDCPFPHVTV